MQRVICSVTLPGGFSVPVLWEPQLLGVFLGTAASAATSPGNLSEMQILELLSQVGLCQLCFASLPVDAHGHSTLRTSLAEDAYQSLAMDHILKNRCWFPDAYSLSIAEYIGISLPSWSNQNLLASQGHVTLICKPFQVSLLKGWCYQLSPGTTPDLMESVYILI